MCGSNIFFQDGGRKILEKRKKIYVAFMDLEKAYDRVDWLALWEVLRIYGVGGKPLSAIKSFYEAASACVKINGKTSEHFEIEVGDHSNPSNYRPIALISCLSSRGH